MGLQSEELFNKMGAHLKTNGADIVKKVQAVFFFEVREKKGDKPTVFTVDLKNGSGRAYMTLQEKSRKARKEKQTRRSFSWTKI